MILPVITNQNFENGIFEIEYYYRTFESDNRAEKVLESINENIFRIRKNPLEFPIVPEYKKEEIRKAVVHNTFIIYFKLSIDKILLLDIFHGKMDK